ncbi:MAG: fumarate hydratase [Candidatus Altiarchaeales archaeon ex4484_43]|nr:MAG: fumarate hydratase [Candidatus Altiarchaeales archaeon ex4484_43]RLI89612.1 MAG: fumarate hydratase [Candidatus Altiarchaeales archaeon]
MISEKTITEAIVELLRRAETDLPGDVELALKRAYTKEKSELGKIQLREILENVKLARKKSVPICQDTGIINFYVGLGNGVRIDYNIEDILRNATKLATEKIPLRPNAVNPLTRKNSNDNTGIGIPNIELKILRDRDYIEITALPKGAGSENMCKLKMLKPSDGIEGIKRFVLESVAEARGNPCPPGIIGIGIGGSSDLATRLAKRALLRKVGEGNRDKEIAELERELERDINRLGIGPMGLGGVVTCLGINIETSYCHTGSLPVAINIGCWATRRATVRIYDDGVEFL